MTSAQLRAARAYLGWTMEQAATAAELHRRTIIRLENGGTLAGRQLGSLRKLVTCYQMQGIILHDNGLQLNRQNSQKQQRVKD